MPIIASERIVMMLVPVAGVEAAARRDKGIGDVLALRRDAVDVDRCNISTHARGCRGPNCGEELVVNAITVLKHKLCEIPASLGDISFGTARRGEPYGTV